MTQTEQSQQSSPEHLLNLRRLRESTYLPNEQAPYHGVSHPDVVWEKASLLIEQCERNNIPVDKASLRDAVELHDALCHVDPKLLGFSSAEHLAANLTQRYLICCGYSQETAQRVGEVVMATNPDVRPRTPEEIIIRAADLWNIGGDYQGFVDASRALHREAMNTRRAEVPFESFLQGSYGYLQKFLWPMLELTPNARDQDGRSVWHVNAMRNLSRQWKDTFGEETPVVAEFFAKGAIAPRVATEPRTLSISMHPDEERRREALELTKEAVRLQNGAAFVIPSTSSGFSLPDGLCDSVVIHDSSIEAVREGLRVCKTGGSIILNASHGLDPKICEIAKAFRCVTLEPSDRRGQATLIILKDVLL